MPSGLDADKGKTCDIIVKADYTITIAMPKLGLKNPKAKKYIGRLYLADITVPAEAYKKIGVKYKNNFLIKI